MGGEGRILLEMDTQAAVVLIAGLIVVAAIAGGLIWLTWHIIHTRRGSVAVSAGLRVGDRLQAGGSLYAGGEQDRLLLERAKALDYWRANVQDGKLAEAEIPWEEDPTGGEI